MKRRRRSGSACHNQSGPASLKWFTLQGASWHRLARQQPAAASRCPLEQARLLRQQQQRRHAPAQLAGEAP